MSTITMNYADVSRVRQVSPIGRILILGSIVLVAITVLVVLVSASNADLTERVVVSQKSIAPIAVPVPAPASLEIQPVSSGTPAPYPGETGGPSVVPVRVPTPPAQ